MLASIVIPTVDRRASLIGAIEGCRAQRGVPGAFEIVVIDNSPDGRQRWVEAQGRGEMPLRYLHEPRAGLAHARNLGISACRGRYLVFLDDDERPLGTSWLAGLLTAAVECGADALFGPVAPEFEDRQPAPFIARLYTRDNELPRGAPVSCNSHKLGTGNSCFLLTTCFGSGERFDPRLNTAGGEDVDMIRRLEARGLRLAWVPGASVVELVPAARTQPRYLAQRRFRQGQIRTTTAVGVAPVRYDRMLYWMTAGAAQAAYHVLWSMGLSLVGRHDAATLHRVQAWGGLGKIFWSRHFIRRNYAPDSSGTRR